MIQKMIFHLMSEQKDEDDHKNWCDKEIDQTTMMKEDKTAKQDELKTAMDQLSADIAADFASMEAGARADETTQQEEYDTWLTGAQIDKSQKMKDSEMKEARKGRLSEKLEAKTGDHSHVTKELEATVQYEKDLQHACVDGDSTYADR